MSQTFRYRVRLVYIVCSSLGGTLTPLQRYSRIRRLRGEFQSSCVHATCFLFVPELTPVLMHFPSSVLLCCKGCGFGFAGVRSSNGTGKICCVEGCGTCGGEGCSDRPGLTKEDCCTSVIRDFGLMCDNTGAAPCIIEKSGEFCLPLTFGWSPRESVRAPATTPTPVGAAWCLARHIDRLHATAWRIT